MSTVYSRSLAAKTSTETGQGRCLNAELTVQFTEVRRSAGLCPEGADGALGPLDGGAPSLIPERQERLIMCCCSFSWRWSSRSGNRP